MRELAWRCARHAISEDRLHTVEQILRDQRLEVAAFASDAVIGHVNDSGIQLVRRDTTPYLDRHNDYTQIYVRRDNGAFMLTDGGETIQDVRASGCDLEASKRRDLLTSTLNGFGIRRDGDALLVRATPQDFSLRKHNLVQAILAVNDLFYLSVPVVASLFLEDVTAWLELHDIRFTRNVKFTGRSGYDHTFDL